MLESHFLIITSSSPSCTRSTEQKRHVATHSHSCLSMLVVFVLLSLLRWLAHETEDEPVERGEPGTDADL